MEKTQTPHKKLGKPPATKKKKKAKFSQKAKVYCILCRSTYLKHEAHEHMHSMLHHRELETVLGKDSFHDCQACKESSMALNEYAQHISTSQHKAKLKSLRFKNVKPLPLLKTLGQETLGRVLDRNKKLKSQQKKAMKKQKKKLKQAAGQKPPEMLQGESGRRKKQVNLRILKQMQATHQQGSNSAVFQNKENKMLCLQRLSYQRESTLQNQSRTSFVLSGEPAGQTWNQPEVRDQFTQSVQQMRFKGNFAVNDQGSRVKAESSQTDTKPHSTQGGANHQPEQRTWPVHSQNHYYTEQYDSDFTSDHLPQSGALIFDKNESLRSSQPAQEGPHAAKSASANRSENAAPIRDVDVTSMLRQIRRALGVREPCRADREARRQNSEAGTRAAVQGGAEKEQPVGGIFRNHIPSAAATSVQPSHFNSPTPASRSCPSSIASAKTMQTTVKLTQGMNQRCEKSSVVAGDSNESSYSREGAPQVALNAQTSLRWTASSEPNVNITRKVRIARKAAGNLLSLSGTQRKPSWREMYEEMKRKKLESVKGMPRFGIQLAKRADREQSTRAENNDMPLSEGFHWESFPDSPSAAHWAGLTLPLQATTVTEPHTEAQSDSRSQEHLEQPGAAQEVCNNQTAEAVPVKVEPNLEGEDRELRSSSVVTKRKPSVVAHGGVSDEPSTGKKKRAKSHKDQDQMEQLLAVSLREEELSQSLQDLDKSLVQARNALQAAYTEVQRLLLFRQQCTTEVNSLRTKRIEILQGMQGGYSGASNAAEKANTSSAGAAAIVQPTLSPLPSPGAFPTASSQQPPPSNPAASIIPPHTNPLALPAMQLKQEMCQLPTVSETPQVPVNTPMQLFSSNLLPSLLLTAPHLAAPTTAVTSLTQFRAEGSTSAITSPESSARLQGHTAREESKDSVQMVKLVSEEEQEVDSEVEILPAARSSPAVAVDEDGGDESDHSVEMMPPSNTVVIDIDESDNEEAVSNVAVHKEPPRKSVSVEFSSAGAQTSQLNNAERKVQPPVKDTNAPPESVEVLDDKDLYLGAFMNHNGPVHSLQVHDGRLYTCSGDNTARAYSLMDNECQVVFEGHTNKVNCLLVASVPNMPARLYTGSSDQTIRCYSIKTNKCLEQISLSDRVLCLHVAWNILFAGLANGSVASYDLKTLKQLDVFECHGPRGVSCLGTAQEGARRVLLVGSYDSTISVRDAKSGLLLRSLDGHTKTVLCMKVVNDLVFSGSSDTSVHAYNIHTGELVRIYKGHGHAVTSIVILGKVMVTASLDKLVRIYELQSHDRLQVYGGHSDMLMCMTVHKSVIYTGCYDGSVQAVKLNLMENHRCWWQNCSLIFGMAEHLVQHLVGDHSNPKLQTLKCRWRNCSTFFPSQQSVREELPEHMKSHVEKESQVQH